VPANDPQPILVVYPQIVNSDENSDQEDIQFEAEMLDNFELYKRMNPIN
jgi:hypothetical protein